MASRSQSKSRDGNPETAHKGGLLAPPSPLAPAMHRSCPCFCHCADDSAREVLLENEMSREAQSKATIHARILVIRGLSIILDVDLAGLIGVAPGVLLQGVRRNRKRFPSDFLFQLTNQELAGLKSQSVISNP